MVALVDTDSFAKWGAHLLAAAPAGWDLDLRTVATPRSASAKQLRSAFRGLDARLAHLRTDPPTPKNVDAVVEELRVDPPDAVLVSLIGPVAELVIDEVHRRIPDRPVLVSGLPGISFPAKWKGIFFRARADLFVLHSHREVRAYEEMAIEGGVVPRFALATLPFARSASASASTGATASASTGAPASASTGAPDEPVRDAVVFAAQPSVPLERVDRALVVEWLVATARQHPEWRVVIKTRAAAGEHQTHREEHPYPDLVPADAPANLAVERADGRTPRPCGGPRDDQLDGGARSGRTWCARADADGLRHRPPPHQRGVRVERPRGRLGRPGGRPVRHGPTELDAGQLLPPGVGRRLAAPAHRAHGAARRWDARRPGTRTP
ncbi:hypothetical protein QP157_18705 [Sphingomonas sp. LR61]